MRHPAWPAETRAKALDLYVELGPAEASRQTGVSKGTIASWANRNHLQTLAVEHTHEATRKVLATREQRVAELAEELLEIARMRSKRLRQSIEANSEREMAQVMEIAITKAQLLSGQATVRVEEVNSEHRESLAKILELRQAS